MGWNLDSGLPIYSQLIEQLQCRIVSGTYAPGSRLASVRDLANEASVNPNTMQRAMTELERLGLIYTERTNGRYITENKELIAMTKKKIALEKIGSFIDQMRELGYKKEEMLELMEEASREVKGNE
ncbi:MAG: GntR family transcriptional regulator [Oscillospiraceae bacterium]|nr:GntR family transcriptional regulator [Oscillospiraceae bacterium]